MHKVRFGIRSLPEPPDGRVALVSGGDRGLGLQVVRMLAEKGMRVVLAGRSVESGRAALGSLGDLADRVGVQQLDITDTTSVARLALWLGRRLGRCDVLVNNAAVLIDDDRTAAGADLEAVRRTLETNLLGTWLLTQAVVPLMRGHSYGRIVTVTSGLGGLAATRHGVPAYRVWKSGIHGLTRMLAEDLTGDGILVNACCPGPSRVGSEGGGELILLSASAHTPVWLATLPDDGPTGGFHCEHAPAG